MKGKITYSKEETALFEALGRFIAEASEVDPDEFVKEFRKGNTVEMKYATMSSKVVDGEHVTEIEIDPALAVQVGEVVKDNADNFDAFFVSATAYSAHDPGNGSRTAMGTPVRHGVIAVDPSVIPLGTRVFIPGYGEAVAEDVGGAIHGNRIDVAFDTHEEAIFFGWQELEIFIME